MGKTLYLKLNKISTVHEKDVFLKDVASLYSDDQAVLAKCGAIKVKTIHDGRNRRYVEDVLDILRKISETDAAIQVTNLGETDYIIDYQRPHPAHPLFQWIKTAWVCVVCFCGAAFAIMTFNNDASVTNVFQEIYRMVLGSEWQGDISVLELTYSIGLAAGILVFFNHFAAWKLNTDPTPLEVEMRLYEDNISKTLIASGGREEPGSHVT